MAVALYAIISPTANLMEADLIITNIGELVTCSSIRPKRRSEMLDVGLIEQGAVAIKDGKFVAVGPSTNVLKGCSCEKVIDAGGKVVCPGFVDPHTHIVFAGDRLNEFELKIKGAQYLEILEKGGGIISTVGRTRDASIEELVVISQDRLSRMLACGTTTCEIKTGYGLDLETELNMLGAIAELASKHDIEIVPTFLAAHAIPAEYKDNPNGYVNMICDTMLPAAWSWFVGSGFHGRTPFFCDVFCEKGAFTLEQTKRVLKAAKVSVSN